MPEGVQPKNADQYTLIGGEDRLRVDSAGKILGTTRYTIDVALPEMVTAPSQSSTRTASSSRWHWPGHSSRSWVIRPDRYVMAAGRAEEFERITGDICRMLGCSSGHQGEAGGATAA